MKHKKKVLFQSLISLLLCFSMLVGITFAWFTDGVSSGTNMIAAGSLDIELDYLAADGTWKPVDENTEVLDKDALWEPGHTEVAYLRITNAGSLALKYALGIGILGEIGSTNTAGEAFKLSDYIEFGVVESESEITYAERADARNALTETKLIREGYSSEYSMKNKGDVRYVALVVYMPESVGNAANYATGKNPPKIELGIELVATQEVHESDSFGKDYDTGAVVPGFTFPENVFGESATEGVTADANNKVAADVTIQGSSTNAVIPAGVQLEDGADALTLEVTSMNQSNANITLGENDAARSLNVHVEGVSADNTVPMEICIKEAAANGLNAGNLKLYHVENGVTVEMTAVDTFTAHNQFKYDPATGDITLYMATFSEVAVVADTVNAWEGKFDYTWYDASKTELTIANADQLAAFGAIVGGMNGQTKDSFAGKTVKLIADVNLGDKENDNNPNLIFYPIGYYNSTGSYEKTSGGSVTSSVSSFEGTFDGNGHTIANFYQNTWEMFGDYNDGYSGTPNHYKDAMGLFGYVLNGTVKNLTVSNFSSDGEYTPTGVIAAYADGNSTFENIAITNCNPRVYNTGNGGIIGIAGDTSATNDDHITLKNITVDNSNKISALWGSWDVACGGLVGMYRGNVDGSGNATGDTISFENCHVSAIIDVYNDVCANYQYYAYRYAGMIIGSVRHNTKNDEGKVIPNMTGISATGCTVNYGDWNDYYYCEFEKNTMASYSEDYQFSRVPHSELNFTDSNGNGVVDADERASVTGCKHTHTAEENHQAIYLPFHQLFTGYSWGVSSIGLEELEGIENITVTIGKEESVLKFESAFPNTSVNEEGEIQTNFLYRVGNLNEIKVGSLFEAINKEQDDINDSGVYVRIDKLYDDANVTCTFNPAGEGKEWTEGTLKFEGTGVVDIVIQDYDFCKPTVLKLEVVDATNATSATSATKNNVVLLNDCNFSSLEVSGGYTLYGNGFTMTCGSDSAALDMGYSFVTLNNGTLDNVQIVCPNFDYAVLYKSNMTESGNRSETTDRTRYFNVKSGVMVSGNSQILNSRISGGRAAVNVSGGNCVIDNSRIELGAVASILVGSANSLTLRDVTLVQKPTTSTYDPSKTLMGFSVLFVCDENGDAAPVTLEGTLVQNAWVDENDKQYVPSAGQSIISTVLGKTEYLHDIEGDGKNESLNLGFAYMPESLTSKVNTTTITDNRTNKNDVPYDYAEVSILNGKTYVYSYKNTKGTADGFKSESDYVPNKNGDIITITYADSVDGLTAGKTFGTDGWVYELNVDLDKLSGYVLDFSKLSMSVNGVNITDFKVNDGAKPTSPVPVTAGGVIYTLTATVNGKEYTATYKVTGTETSKESPSLVAANYEAGLCVASSYGGTWHGAAPALQGIQIKYWSVAEKQYKTINLSDYTPTTKGKLNDTNTTWTYSPANGDFTLTLTGGQVHSSNNVYAMPVSVDTDGDDTADTLYFVAASSNGLVNSGNSARTIPVSYTFKDNNNGDVLTFSHTWSVEENKDAQYKYSDFCNGTLTQLESCVTAGTLMTMADGTQKPVEELKVGDELLVFNHITGELEAAPLIFNTHSDDAYDYYDVLNLQFSNGTEVEVVASHGFFDMTLMEYVYIDYENYKDFLGHEFYGNGEIVTLTDAFIEEEYTAIYCPVTYFHMNSFANGMLNTPNIPGGITGLVNYFEYDADLKYNEEAMQRDIEKYGLYSYADFSDYISEAAYNSSPAVHLKVAVGKGMITFEQIVEIIEYLLAGSLID